VLKRRMHPAYLEYRFHSLDSLSQIPLEKLEKEDAREAKATMFGC